MRRCAGMTALHEGRGGLLADSTGNQASSRLLSMRSANALLELPQGEGVLAAGSTSPLCSLVIFYEQEWRGARFEWPQMT